MSPEAARALALFQPLPLRERLFVRGRLFTAPLEELTRRAPPTGRIADIGCGHGLLSALLIHDHPGRQVLGVDPDPRKIDWARSSVGRHPNARFELGSSQTLPSAAFEAIVVADVLYLLPSSQWPAFFADCRRALVPGGKLVLKETENDGSWRYFKCLAQEQLMVRALRRTRSSGALQLMPRAFTVSLLEKAGFDVRSVETMSHGYTTPHVLFAADCV
jgi:cyclopropane fatty-acyl-phospholipid synthase-like methyltransferase